MRALGLDSPICTVPPRYRKKNNARDLNGGFSFLDGKAPAVRAGSSSSSKHHRICEVDRALFGRGNMEHGT
jgi:hypothetical protein